MIDARECHLRVLAGCVATIIAGWAVLAASQVVGAHGLRALFWGAGGLWSLLWSGLLLARALGHQRRRSVWLNAATFILHLPFITLIALSASPPASLPLAKSVADTNGNHFTLTLGIASMAALAFLATAGYLVESRRVPSPR